MPGAVTYNGTAGGNPIGAVPSVALGTFKGFNRFNRTVLYMDSMGGGMNSSFAVTSITVRNGVATAVIASHGLGAGQTFMLVNCTPFFLNGISTVATRIDANTFTFNVRQPFGGLAATDSGTGGAMTMTDLKALNDRNVMQLASAQLVDAFGDIVNCGINGVTARYLAANFDSYVNPLNPDHVAIWCGVNSYTNGDQEAAVTADIFSMVDKCLARNWAVTLFETAPLGSAAAGYSVAIQKTLMRGNNLLRQGARKRGSNIAFIPAYAIGVNSNDFTGEWKTSGGNSYSTDSKHGLAFFSKEVADLIVSYYAPLFPRSPGFANSIIDRFSTDAANRQLCSNATFNGVGGNAAGITAGTVADSFTATRSAAGTVAGSSAVRADGRGNNQILTCTAMGAAEVVDLIGNSSHTAVFAGDELILDGNIFGSNLLNVASVEFFAEITCDGNTYFLQALRPNGGAGAQLLDTFSFDLRSPGAPDLIFRIPTDAVAITVCRPRARVTMGSAAGTITFGAGAWNFIQNPNAGA